MCCAPSHGRYARWSDKVVARGVAGSQGLLMLNEDKGTETDHINTTEDPPTALRRIPMPWMLAGTDDPAM